MEKRKESAWMRDVRINKVSIQELINTLIDCWYGYFFLIFIITVLFLNCLIIKVFCLQQRRAAWCRGRSC